ncbi:MAG: hypothetical protein KF861_02030 [Planctomycetaceae bacterium]|nr:hypothetical protein [Planctomycetaceae bacterium]
MSDDGNHEERGRLRIWPVLMVLVLLIGYPLSTGPVVWLAERGHIDENNPVWGSVYVPLLYVCEESPFILELMERYIRFWESAGSP